jgi:thiopeptide-type bacteriocin biosynthesis protein
MIELSRAQCAQTTDVRWGTAASLPYRPRLRYGRFILAPAAWQMSAADLPDAAATGAEWAAALTQWRQRQRMPQHVRLNVDDMRLLLDLDQPGHQELLRRHVSRRDRANLTEVVDPAGAGWCDGRAHEIIVPLRAVTPPPWPTLPAPSPARLGQRDDGERPGTSTLVYAQLFGDLRRQDIVLAEHLPSLLATFEQEPEWWFLRYRDADRFDPHLRLRIRVADLDAVAGTMRRISAWAGRLHHDRLIREVRFPTSYAEPGRWGGGPVLRAAERVFAADSRAVLAQLRQPRQPDRQALIAAHTVAICSAFLGSTTAAMDWIIEHVAAAPSRTPIPRPIHADAVRIADPDDDWAALRARPGGAQIAAAWQARNDAIVQWRAALDTPSPDVEGVRLDDALRHALHGHYIRARGIDFDDEPACLHLTRSAALAWTARRREPRS